MVQMHVANLKFSHEVAELNLKFQLANPEPRLRGRATAIRSVNDE